MKRTDNKMITPQQLKAIQAELSNMGYDAETRHEFIASFTSGRTSSTKSLTFDEARLMLNRLLGNEQKSQTTKVDEAKKLLRAIYHLSFSISFLNAGFDNESEEDRLMNFAKINRFTRERGAFRKNVTQMTIEELGLTKKQFEALAHKEA